MLPIVPSERCDRQPIQPEVKFQQKDTKYDQFTLLSLSKAKMELALTGDNLKKIWRK